MALILVTSVDFLDINHHPFFIQNNISVTGCCLHPQLGPTDELVLVSRHQNPYKAEHINQIQHKPSVGIKTNISKRHIHEVLYVCMCKGWA
jgi:hypothetical protein